jgi:hypothetical protein
VNVEDASFLVIDPNDRVLVHASQGIPLVRHDDIMGTLQQNSYSACDHLCRRMPAMREIDSFA